MSLKNLFLLLCVMTNLSRNRLTVINWDFVQHFCDQRLTMTQSLCNNNFFVVRLALGNINHATKLKIIIIVMGSIFFIILIVNVEQFWECGIKTFFCVWHFNFFDINHITNTSFCIEFHWVWYDKSNTFFRFFSCVFYFILMLDYWPGIEIAFNVDILWKSGSMHWLWVF